MRGRLTRWSAAAAGVAALGVALGLLVPLAFAGGDHAKTQKRAAQLTCSGQTGPAFPLELNTVTTNGGALVKSIAMEKEIFACQSAAGGPPITRDVETFVDLVERATTTTVGGAPPVVTIATCDKTPSQGLVTCKSQRLPVTLKPTPPFFRQDCNLSTAQPQDPVEMNSVNVLDTFVKTIKVEKEIYQCNDATLIGDLYVFTEMIEKKNANGSNFNSLPARFTGVFCVKGRTTGEFDPAGCVWFKP